MLDRNKVIALVKQKGPVLPVHITKELNTSPIFAGAILSELVDNKLLRLSSAKIGGSPVYFVEGQEGKLPGMLYNYLHEKEKKAYDMLKSSGILRDRDEEPVVRVALRAIKDFAIPFEVKKGDHVEIFWKYFLISDNDAEKSIREILVSETPAAQEEKKTLSKKKIWAKTAQFSKTTKKKVSKSKQSQKKSKKELSKSKQNKTIKGKKITQQKNPTKKQSKTSSSKKNSQKRKKSIITKKKPASKKKSSAKTRPKKRK